MGFLECVVGSVCGCLLVQSLPALVAKVKALLAKAE